jgi:rhodanese-related sulfurtransferase
MRLLILVAIGLALTGCGSAALSNSDAGVPTGSSTVKDVSPNEAAPAVAKAYSQFIDVRTPEEYAAGHAARSVNIPLDILSANLDRLEKNEPVYVICETGGRSAEASKLLKDAGFPNVLNVKGGTAAWRAANLPMETKPPHGGATPL